MYMQPVHINRVKADSFSNRRTHNANKWYSPRGRATAPAPTVRLRGRAARYLPFDVVTRSVISRKRDATLASFDNKKRLFLSPSVTRRACASSECSISIKFAWVVAAAHIDLVNSYSESRLRNVQESDVNKKGVICKKDLQLMLTFQYRYAIMAL